MMLVKAARALSMTLLIATFGVCTRSVPTAPTPLDLAGTWSGMLGLQGSGNAVRLTWVATAAGATVTGPLTMTKPAFNIAVTGTLTATVVGVNLALNHSVAAGSVPEVAECSMRGGGGAQASASTITGTLNVTVTSCDRAGIPATDSQLSLTKQ